MRTHVPYPALLMVTLVLVAGNLALVAYFLAPAKKEVLTVSFLDVGQGDAILIESPTGVQVLIDAGKDRSALRQIPRVMGPLDRSLDAVVATHPDADHIGGLPDVLARYRVSYVLLSGRDADTSQSDRFADAIGRESGAVRIEAREGMKVHLGQGAYLELFHPEGNVDKLRDTNDASIVARLVYGETAFLLTGDAPLWVEERLVREHAERLRSDVLKAGHHGSRTSTGDTFLAAVNPEIVVVSAGKNNAYGHPHEEVLENVREAGARVLSTAEEGTITFVSDGREVSRR